MALELQKLASRRFQTQGFLRMSPSGLDVGVGFAFGLGFGFGLGWEK